MYGDIWIELPTDTTKNNIKLVKWSLPKVINGCKETFKTVAKKLFNLFKTDIGY